jgi:hypothetical protein
MLSIALEIGLVFGINLINRTITHEGRWINFCSNMVVGFKSPGWKLCPMVYRHFEAVSRGYR